MGLDLSALMQPSIPGGHIERLSAPGQAPHPIEDSHETRNLHYRPRSYPLGVIINHASTHHPLNAPLLLHVMLHHVAPPHLYINQILTMIGTKLKPTPNVLLLGKDTPATASHSLFPAVLEKQPQLHGTHPRHGEKPFSTLLLGL